MKKNKKKNIKKKQLHVYHNSAKFWEYIISVIHICYICISRQRKYKQNMPDIEEDILEYLTLFNSQKKTRKF